MANDGRSLGSEERALIAELAHAPERTLGPLSPGETPAGAAGRPRALEPGEHVGRFVVTGRLGVGGMGEVYAANDGELRRRVALKVMRARRRPQGGPGLQQEAQAMARLQHANVVTVYDVGRLETGEEFVAMELVDGGSLRQWLAAQERSPREILRVFIAAGRGLWAAHQAGIVHRDFKPDNVLVGKDGSVRVADFGLALPLEPAPGEAQARPAGTPRYMADEQWSGQRADARSDQFSFCVALYEALAGRHPFEVHDSAGRFTSLDRPTAASPPRSPLPAPVWPAILRGLSRDSAARHESMDALLREMERDPWQKRRRWAAAALALVATVASALGARAWSRHRSELCSGAERRLAGVWDAPRRSALASAFARAIPRDGKAAAAALRALDDYAGTLVAGHRDACEAAQIRGEQSAQLMDLRMGCVGRLSGELSALVALLEHADAKLAGNAPATIAKLRPASVCADVAALSAPDPRPQETGRRAQIDALERRYDEALALFRAVRPKEALSIVEQLLPEVRAAGWAPFTAEVWHLAGLAREDSGDAAGAQAAFEQALIEAANGRHQDEAANAWTSLAINLGRVQFRLKEARLVARLAHATVDHLGNKARAQRLEQAEGLLATSDGQYREGLEHYKRALAIEEQRNGDKNPRGRAELINSMGNAAHRLGDMAEARALFEQAIALYDRELGPDNAGSAGSMSNLAYVANEEGKPAEAEALARRTLALYEKQFGPKNRRLMPSLLALAHALNSQGRADEALAVADRALAISAAENGPEHRTTLDTRVLRGAILADLGREAESTALLRETLAVQERVLAAHHPDRMAPLEALGCAALRAGDAAEAARRFGASIDVARAAGLPDGAISHALAGLAVVEALRKHPVEARARAAEARARLDPKPVYWELSFVLYAEGMALRASGDGPGARAAFDEALRVWPVKAGVDVAMIRAALAKR
jgi:tetratricopeptide (TPR) repeat protein/predicted Ser/Thr protein kinase